MNMVLIFRKRSDGGIYCTIRPEYLELYDLPEGTIVEVEIKTIKRPEESE